MFRLISRSVPHPAGSNASAHRHSPCGRASRVDALTSILPDVLIEGRVGLLPIIMERGISNLQIRTTICFNRDYCGLNTSHHSANQQ
jgi:hypothetical protein